MKRIFILLTVALAGISLTGCEYDDNDLWSAVEEVENRVTKLEEAVAAANGNIAALQSLVTALQNAVTITAVNETADGYTISFSDGSTATITNGKDANAPVVSVREDTDGVYYWTVDGEWLLVDGEKVRASAEDGAAAVAPQIRINETTKEWEISTDGGQVWTSTGIVAEGRDAEDNSLFQSVDTTSEEYVIFVLSDGTEIRVARYDDAAPVFAVEGAEGVQQILFGQTKSYAVTTKNVADYSIAKPDGWRVSYEAGKIDITAPVAENTYAETEGEIAFNLVSETNKSLIVKIRVKAVEELEYELRVLTFEDADARFEPYVIAGCGATVSTWSDLIDTPQNGGPLLYNDYVTTGYKWHDAGNTELASGTIDEGPFWNGGHVLSNYYAADFAGKSYEQQLEVSTGAEGAAGHDGSKNFCVQNGYVDDMSYSTSLPSLTFADGVARVVDHMYVVNTNYVLNSLVNGDSFSTAAGADTWFKIVAEGFDAAGASTGTAEFFLCNGSAQIVTEWTKFDLSALGEVVRIEFNIKGSDDLCGSWGLNTPAYFAYDDVAVRF